MPARYDIRIKTLVLTLNKGGVSLSRVDICNAAFTFEASLDLFSFGVCIQLAGRLISFFMGYVYGLYISIHNLCAADGRIIRRRRHALGKSFGVAASDRSDSPGPHVSDDRMRCFPRRIRYSAVVRLPSQVSAASPPCCRSTLWLAQSCRYRDIFMTTKETEAVSFAFTTVGSKHSVDVQLKGVPCPAPILDFNGTFYADTLKR